MGLERYFKDVRSDDFDLEIASGRISSIAPIFKFGENPAIGSGGGYETIWDGGGLYAYPGVATAMTASSSSGDDTSPAGDGARTIRVFGLDEQWRWIVQDVALDGTTPVSLPTPLLRVFRAFVLTAGSNGATAGTIYVGSGAVAAGVPAVSYAQIRGGATLRNQTFMSVFTVPLGWTGYITNLVATIGDDVVLNGAVILTLLSRDNEASQPFQAKCRASLYNGSIVRPLRPYLRIPEKSDVEVRGDNLGANAVEVHACFDLLLEKNNFDVPDLSGAPG